MRLLTTFQKGQVRAFVTEQMPQEADNLDQILAISFEYVAKKSFSALKKVCEKIAQDTQHAAQLKIAIFEHPSLYRTFLNINATRQQQLLEVVANILDINNNQQLRDCSLQIIGNPYDGEVTAAAQDLHDKYNKIMQDNKINIMRAYFSILIFSIIIYDPNNTIFQLILFISGMNYVVKNSIKPRLARQLMTCAREPQLGRRNVSLELHEALFLLISLSLAYLLFRNCAQLYISSLQLVLVATTIFGIFICKGFYDDISELYDCRINKKRLTDIIKQAAIFANEMQPVAASTCTTIARR